MLHLLLKSLHIMAVISWMAGLLYLYRLFVYHRAETEAVVMARFQVMERRLWRAITVPAAWVTVLTGGVMIALQPCVYLPNGWMQLKLLLVLGMLHIHFKAGRFRKAFEQSLFPLTERSFRFLNEVPTLLMVGIVLLVIFRPDWWVWTFCR